MTDLAVVIRALIDGVAAGWSPTRPYAKSSPVKATERAKNGDAFLP